MIESSFYDLPTEYEDLLTQQELADHILDTVLDPELNFSRAGDEIAICLYGSRYVKGERHRYKAISIHHNWVTQDGLIYPLPGNTRDRLKSLFGDISSMKFSFADVLRIASVNQNEFLITIDQSLSISAKDEAHKLKADELCVDGLNAELFPYQSQGVQWLSKNIQRLGGCILADEMGLGKTIQVISLLLTLKPSHQSPALVICPTSLITNWCTEIKRFAPDLSFGVHRGQDRAGIPASLKKVDVIITTYGTAVADCRLLAAINWTWVILDEAQAIKNPESERRLALSMIKGKYHLPMTGTLVENSLMDLWAITDFAIPGILGSKEQFAERYPDDETSAAVINELVSPLILRRLVKHVAKELPERTDINLPIDMDHAQATEYERIRQETLDEYGVSAGLVATTRLSLFCAHPSLYRKVNAEDDVEIIEAETINTIRLETPKIKVLKSILSEAFASKRKVLIFSRFNGCYELIRQAADNPNNNTYWEQINGTTPQEDRQRIVDKFTSIDGNACLVLNPNAAGAGLNITAATIVVHFTPNWNPAIEAQASARAHRKGQTQPVMIYKLYYADTVEEVMIERSEWKRELSDLAVPLSGREQTDMKKVVSITPAGTK